MHEKSLGTEAYNYKKKKVKTIYDLGISGSKRMGKGH